MTELITGASTGFPTELVLSLLQSEPGAVLVQKNRDGYVNENKMTGISPNMHPNCNYASQDLSCLQAHEFLNGKYLPPTKSPPVLLDALLSVRLSVST